jgi:DNA-binding LytR/AlgR family response regulator
MIKYIIITDKENVNGVKAFIKILESAGFSEFQKENPERNGIRKSSSTARPDLVIFDQSNPKEPDLIKLRTNWPHAIIVAICKTKEPAWKAYELGFEDYVISPFKKDRVFKSILKIKDAFSLRAGRFEDSDAQFFFIREKEMLRKLKISDILFIQAFGDYINIHTAAKRMTVHFNLKYIIKKLPEKNFIRVHKSFIVNLNRVEKIQGNSVYLNSHQVPVGDAFRKDLNKSLNILK